MKNLTALTLIGSVLLLASCNQTKLPNDLTSVSGTVVEGEYKAEVNGTVNLVTTPWKGGVGSVVASLGNASAVTRTATALAEDGKFNLPLPTPTAAQLTTLNTALDQVDLDITGPADECQGTVSVSEKEVRAIPLLLEVDASKDGPIFPTTASDVVSGTNTVINISSGVLLYVDRGLTVKGIQTCKQQDFTTIFDVNLTLRRGWNKLNFTFKGDKQAKEETVTVRSGSLLTDNWVYMKTGQTSLGNQGLKLLRLPFLR